MSYSQEAANFQEQQADQDSDILSCFPKHLTPRQVQIDTLKEVERSWRANDVFVINLPVAAGKSAISQTIAKWSSKQKKSALTLASNNILVDQYLKDYPRLAKLNGKARYYCKTLEMSLKTKAAKKLPLCSKDLNCPGCDERRSDERKMFVVPWALMNYHVYLSMGQVPMFQKTKGRFTTLIVDEAHNLIPVLQELGASKIWYHKIPDRYKYNLNMKSIHELRTWLEKIPDQWDYEGEEDKHVNVQKFKAASYSNHYMFKIGEDEYRGEMMPCIKLLPMTLTDEAKKFFDPAVSKLILMSATISRKDIEELGLSSRRIKYISAASPIPSEQRPVVYGTNAVNMSYNYQTLNLPTVAKYILKLAAEFPDSKGLVHVPYSLALKLRPALSSTRFMFHDQINKMAVYKAFREAEEPRILVASGMYEGVDLPYEAGRFQALVKVPYPSLADPAVAFKAEKNPDWYAWETIKLIQQACGRICRGPDDFGATFILDASFGRLYTTYDYFWPKWFKDGLILGEI